MAMTIMDVFQGAQGLFSTSSMTKAILDLPYVPSTIRSMGLFEEERLDSTDVVIQKESETISLIGSTPRGGPGEFKGNNKRSGVKVPTFRLDQERRIFADEIRNMLQTGSLNPVTLEQVRNKKLAEIGRDLDYTEEFHFLNAIKGKLVDTDGSEILDIYALMGVTPPADVTFNFSSAENVKKKVQQVRRDMLKALGADGNVAVRIRALVPDAVWDAMVALPEIKEAYERWQSGEFLRTGGLAYEEFSYAGIIWSNYRGNESVGLANNEIRFFVQSPGLFRVFYAPSDKLSSIGDLGLPRYAWAWPDERDTHITLEGQSNLLAICTKPKTLIKGVVNL